MEFLVTWLVFALSAQAQMVDPETGRRMFGLPTVDYTFPTGFRVVIAPDDTLPVVGTTMMFDAGSAYEPEGRTGMAHLFEHLWFRSTDGNRPPVDEYLPTLGCNYNAWTFLDRVSYSTACPSQVFSRLMQLEGRRLADPTAGLTDAHLTSEQAIVRQEGLTRGSHIDLTDPFTAILHHVHPPGHPYGHLTIGLGEDIARTTMDDIRAYVGERYRPEHTTFVVAGDVDPVKAMRLVFRTFPPEAFHPDLTREMIKRREGEDGPFIWPDDPEQPGKLLPLAEPKQRAVLAWEGLGDWQPPDEPLMVDVKQKEVAVVWMLPPVDTFQAGFTANQLSTAAWYMGLTSVTHLNPKSTGCQVLALQRGTLLFCSATPRDEGNTEPLVKALKQLARGEVYRESSTERGRRVARDRLGNLMGLERIATVASGRSEQIATHAHNGYSSDFLRQTDMMLSAAKLDPAYEWLREHVVPEDARVVHLHPMEERETDNAQTAAAGRAQLQDDVDATARPKEADPFADAYPAGKVVERDLPNGLKIVAIDHGNMPFIDTMLYVPHGLADGPPGVSQLAFLLADTKDSVGGVRYVRQMMDGIQNRHAAFGIRSTLEGYDDAVKDLREGLESMSYSGDQHQDLIRRWRKQREKKKEDRSTVYAQAAIARASHLPTWPSSPSTLPDDLFEELASISAKELRAEIKSTWQAREGVVVIVGNEDARRLAHVAQLELSKWRPKPAQGLTWADAREWPPEKGLVFIDDPEALRADVQLTCIARHEDDRQGIATSLLGDLLRRDAYRLLRQEMGVVYTPASWSSTSRKASRFDVLANIEPKDVVRTAKAEMDLLTRVVDVAYDAERIEKAKLDRVIRTPLSRQTRGDVHGTLAPMLLDGWSVEDWRNTASTMEGIDHAALKKASEGCTQEMLLTITGPAEAYVEEIEAWWGVKGERFVLPSADKDKKKKKDD